MKKGDANFSYDRVKNKKNKLDPNWVTGFSDA
jgi:hypothetical protein